MTELSRFWDGITDGDASDAPYDSSEMAEILAAIGAAEAITTYKSGVFRDVDNELGATPGANKVTIGTGKALVSGRYYKNTTALDITIPDATTGRRDRIVLHRDTAAQTVRLERLAGLDNGGGVAPTIPTGDASDWYMPLWLLNKAPGVGTAPTIITDERVYAPAHNDQSGEAQVTLHSYAQVSGRPLPADSTPETVGSGIVAATGNDTGHYANDNHVHGTSALPFGTKTAATSRSASNVPADDADLTITVLNAHTYVVRVRLVASTTLDAKDLSFTIAGGTGVVLGLTTIAVPVAEEVGSQYFSSLSGVILLKGGITHIIDLEAIVVSTGTTIKFQWNPNAPDGASPVTLGIGSHIYALLGA